MQARHERRNIAVRRDQRVIQIARVTRGVAQPRNARDPGDARDEARERPFRAVRSGAVIGVDVLPDQRHLAHAGPRQTFDLRDDLGDRARYLGAAGIRHDAEAAELVAAFLDGDERAHAARADRLAARGREEVELVLDRKRGVDDAALALRLCQEFRQTVIVLRPDHEVDHRGAAKNFLAFRLGDAAGHGNEHATLGAGRGLAQLAHPAELGKDLLGRLLADVTGIEDDEVGVFRLGGLDEAMRRQDVRHTMGIVDVHLAAVGFDVELAGSAHADAFTALSYRFFDRSGRRRHSAPPAVDR